jgi:hypothetical protein
MGFSRRRRGKDGQPRYTPITAICAGARSPRAPSPGRPARTRRGKRPRPVPALGCGMTPAGDGRRSATMPWRRGCPNHRMELTARADYTPAIYRRIVPRAHARDKAARDRPVSSPPVQRTDGRAAERLPLPHPVRAGTPAIGVRGLPIDALPSCHPRCEGRGGRPPVTGTATCRACRSAPGTWTGNARSA